MAADYGGRLQSSWQRLLLKMGAGLYNALCRPVEAALSLGRALQARGAQRRREREKRPSSPLMRMST